MRLLIVGGLSGQLSAAAKIAMDRGARVAFAEDTATALNVLRKGQGTDLLMVDIRLDIPSFISALQSERFVIPVVACGVEADPDAAVAAIKSGAKEYIPLPPDAELIAAVLEAVADDNSSIIAVDQTMLNVLALAKQVANSEASILITGESGAGKEVIAKHIHENSKRAEQPLISINCAAIPENLLESELFGHEKGAFTGAVAKRVGKFEEANGGTLLLDEISEMDIRLQAKLLRAIQERVIDRVGGTTPIPVDIRILATTNRSLDKEVRDGTFREDLYFRLNVVNIEVPSLRDRRDDIPVLAEHFATKYADLNGLPHRSLSQAAKSAVAGAAWPGNVRELENAMHRAVLLSTGEMIEREAIRISAAPDYERTTGTATSDNTLVGRTVAEVERDLIIETLDHCLGNRTHAASILGISIRTLRNKLKQYTHDGVSVPPANADRASA